jgi:uncharacterized repeat protein (TIGR03803 family)
MQKCSMALAAVVAATLGAGDFAYGAGFKTLYSFKGEMDGSEPIALIALNGKLYGTTALDGSVVAGTVFALTTSGNETVLHYFGGPPDGWLPTRIITMDGYIFGITEFGGSTNGQGCDQYYDEFYGCGTVFGIAPPTGKEGIVRAFDRDSTGASPGGFAPNGLVDMGGTLYVSVSGGPTGYGAVISLRSGVEKVIYSFKGGADGAEPGGLIRIGNTLYGTTGYDGGKDCTNKSCGTIFKLTPDGIETVLHDFTGGIDGKSPDNLVNSGGKLYATVNSGGAFGYGKIVKLNGSKMETVYSFKGGSDGANPDSLICIGDTLYGTTFAGGASSDGTLFSLTRTGQETVLHRFSGADGSTPGSLVQINGKLYGVTNLGGASGSGTVFSFAPQK